MIWLDALTYQKFEHIILTIGSETAVQRNSKTVEPNEGYSKKKKNKENHENLFQENIIIYNIYCLTSTTNLLWEASIAVCNVGCVY